MGFFKNLSQAITKPDARFTEIDNYLNKNISYVELTVISIMLPDKYDGEYKTEPTIEAIGTPWPRKTRELKKVFREAWWSSDEEERAEMYEDFLMMKD